MNGSTIVFDLDGTLVDTAPDLVAATNHVLAHVGRPPVDAVKLRPFVGYGALRMIEEAIGPQCGGTPEFDLARLFERFLAYYAENIANESRPYSGAASALDRFRAGGAALAVCTNKTERLARKLLDELDLSRTFAAITGRDTFPVSKPDPAHLLGTIALAGGDPSRSVMIGDSRVDIATAKAAGVPIVAVSFGYSEVPIRDLDPDAVIDNYEELAPVLQKILNC